MPLLKDVFDVFGYTREKEHIALVKLAAFCNCFTDIQEKKISDISDETARELLKTPFLSLEEGIGWWSKKIDENWLRKNFKIESTGKGKEDFINVERWLRKPEKLEKNKEGEAILDIFQTLELTGSVEWPEEKVDFICMHGGLEENVKRRVSSLPHNLPEDCEMIYSTNPRMLFNHEKKSFAEIVAKAFGFSEEKLTWAIGVIEAVLDEHQDFKKSDKNWLVDPQGLKKLIADRLGLETWHKKTGSYYENPEIYELAAKSGDKPRPSPAGLPTAVDMLRLLLKKRQLSESKTFKNLKVIPLYSVPFGRVATTEDNIFDLYKMYGEKLHNATIVFISDNYSHYIKYQDTVVKESIKKLEGKEGNMNIKVITIGRGNEQPDLLGALDVLAKTFYCKIECILKSLSKSIAKEESLDTHVSPSLRMR
jgi:hypothetical protein